MEKDVLISIRGLQYLMDEESGEQEPVEVMTTGSYYKKNGHHFLIYDEATEGFDMMTHNMIKFTENALEVRKRGLIDVHMIFEEDKRTFRLSYAIWHDQHGSCGDEGQNERDAGSDLLRQNTRSTSTTATWGTA